MHKTFKNCMIQLTNHVCEIMTQSVVSFDMNQGKEMNIFINNVLTTY